VVSKEEVALGRKGSGAALIRHGSRPAGMRGWQGQPLLNGRIQTLAKKQLGCRSSGCRLQVGGAENGLLAIRQQNVKTLFSAARTSNLGLKVLVVLVQRSGAWHFFILNGAAARNSTLALPWSATSPTRAGPGPQAPPPRSSRVVGSWSWSRGELQGLSLSQAPPRAGPSPLRPGSVPAPRFVLLPHLRLRSALPGAAAHPRGAGAEAIFFSASGNYWSASCFNFSVSWFKRCPIDKYDLSRNTSARPSEQYVRSLLVNHRACWACE
jgi:hypothetical protein